VNSLWQKMAGAKPGMADLWLANRRAAAYAENRQNCQFRL
jgi:hypothetical protein